MFQAGMVSILWVGTLLYIKPTKGIFDWNRRGGKMKILERIFYSSLFEELRLNYYSDAYEMGKFEGEQSNYCSMTDKEEDNMKMWESTHDCFIKAERGAAKQIIFTGTGIGWNIRIGCSKCKKSQDITNYDSW